MNGQSIRQIILDALYKVVADRLDPELGERMRDPNNDPPIADIGLDSLEGMEWCIEIEELIGVEVDPVELISAGSFDGLVNLVVDRQRNMGRAK